MSTVTKTVAWNPSPTEGVQGYKVCIGKESDVRENPQAAQVIDVGAATRAEFEVETGVPYFVGVSAYAEDWNESPIAAMTLTVPEGPAAVRGVSSLWAMIRRWFS